MTPDCPELSAGFGWSCGLPVQQTRPPWSTVDLRPHGLESTCHSGQPDVRSVLRRDLRLPRGLIDRLGRCRINLGHCREHSLLE